MENILCSLKSVTSKTVLKAAVLYEKGKNSNVLVDQDGDIVGLIQQDQPYIILGTKLDAINASQKGLREGASYKGYKATHFHADIYSLNLTCSQDILDKPVNQMSCNELASYASHLANQYSSSEDDDEQYYEVPHP